MLRGRHPLLLLGMMACSGVAPTPPSKPAQAPCATQRSWVAVPSQGAPKWTPGARVTVAWTGTQALFAVTEFGSQLAASFFDPCRGMWEPAASAGAPSRPAAIDWIGGRLVAWEVDEEPRAQVYDRVDERWRSRPLPLAARGGASVGSRVAIFEEDERRMVVFGAGVVLDMESGVQIPIAPAHAPSPRVMEATVAVEAHDAVFVYGGRDRSEPAPVQSGALLDLAKGTWTPLAEKNAPTPRYHAQALTHRDQIVVWGGIALDTDNPLTDGASYDPRARRWRSIPPAGEAASDHELAVLSDGHLITVGEASAMQFDFQTRRWRALELPTPMQSVDVRAHALGDGTVLFHHPEGAWFWRYDPRDGSWSSLPPADSVRGAVVIGGDHVIVWGSRGGAMRRL